ncbi:PE-PPE domain-containing protein [Mycobacterium sp. SMC-4]|uniref:PE-PPE domain-containing protein n=1 Tax=Mycobacterium sp. SMC-4 TaxID=2857059 RepID=UPI0021B345E0|nr:PE-PPE domain-containing protein [Mycobacterium sp. SMC-4]
MSSVVAALAAALVIVLAVASAAVSRAASALIMGGTSHALSVPQDTPKFIAKYVADANADYIEPSGLCGHDCSLIAAYSPGEIRFVTGLFDMSFDRSVAIGLANLDNCIRGVSCTVTDDPYTSTGSRIIDDDAFLVYAYSASATVASQQKLRLIANPVDARVNFLMLANPNRPNGGILERFVGAYVPFLGITFDGATSTSSSSANPLTTVDIARQYDGWVDFPTNPLNLLAVLNAVVGTVSVHGNYFDAGDPQLQGRYQDTSYYLIPTPVTPLLTPLTWIPWAGKPLALALDAPLRVLIETGYDRTVNPGQPTPARFFYAPDLFRTAINFAIAIPTGWDDAISYLTGDPDLRPFGTAPVTSPYGVGGPPVYAGSVDPYDDSPATPTEARREAKRADSSEPQVSPATADLGGAAEPTDLDTGDDALTGEQTPDGSTTEGQSADPERVTTGRQLRADTAASDSALNVRRDSRRPSAAAGSRRG